MFLLKRKSIFSLNYNLKQFSTGNSIKKRICIVGGGPAGFYAAQYILKTLSDSYVDIIEKLPVPFGLVRFGVAPDHPEVKNVISTFSKTAENPRFRFLGNLSLGQDVSLRTLKHYYHVVLLAYGADQDRSLGIQNETQANVISAREFVAWYNGLPGSENLNINLNNESATIIGQGNVGIDVARILLTPIDSLKNTDITTHALAMLAQSKIKQVNLVGRRGPMQAAFTIKELREMLKLENCNTEWREKDFDGISSNLDNLQRPRKRLTELMLKSLQEKNQAKNVKKIFNPIFFRSPKSIINNGIEFNVTKLSGDRAIDTEETEFIKSDIIFRSIGYKSKNVDFDLNFNEEKGLVNNVGGRVIKIGTGSDKNIDHIEDKFENGLYVTGWLATGPTGVIVTTMNNSFTIADTICKDISSGTVVIKEKKSGLEISGRRIVTWDKWKKIDEKEREAGRRFDKPREKILKINEMLEIAEV